MTDFNSRQLSTEIDPTDAGSRIDNWLTQRFTYHSRNQWQNLIKEGVLTLNGEKTKSSRKLQSGDIVSFALTKDEPPVSFDYTIAHEDATVLIVNKCGNLPCHPAGPFYVNTLWHHLMLQYGDVFMVNRLDRETSGLIILAKSKEAAAFLSKQIETNTIEKKYYALVHGKLDQQIDADGWLTNDTSSEVRKKRRFSTTHPGDPCNSDSSRTIISPLSYSNNLSLVECTLKTGRLHQIRATLYSLGFPMVGDKLYGLDDTMYLRLPGDQLTEHDRNQLMIPRQALHSYYLSYIHPETNKRVTLTTPLPDEIADLLK